MFLRKIKSGYTLIEMVCAVSIVIIASSLGIKAVKSYNGLKNQIERKYVDNQILNFFNASKNYCKSNKAEGKIFADASLNRLIFYNGFDKCIDKFYFPKGFKLNPINSSHGEISIKENGGVWPSCTIQYQDLRKERKLNTIYIGTGYVRIKK